MKNLGVFPASAVRRESRVVRQIAFFGALGLLVVGSSVPAAASVVANLSSGSAAASCTAGSEFYCITSDTNTGTPDSSYTGPAITVTTLAGGWVADGISNGQGDTGDWVAPNANQGTGTTTDSSTASTTYVVEFNLTGFNPATATLIMNLAADDSVTVTLNGDAVTGFTHESEMWTAATGTFDTTGDFVAGLNTLTFTVPNNTSDGAGSCCGPTGLIVAADVTATSNVPEPSALLPLALAVLVGGFALRRRSRSAA